MIFSYLRPILIIAVVIGLMVAPRPAISQELTFLSGIDDLPLMPGLEEDVDLTLIFDSAEGRFVEAYAVGNVTELAVSEFYRQSLPQLGWLHDGVATFQRDGEVLVILPSPSTSGDASTTVRFALSPFSEKRKARFKHKLRAQKHCVPRLDARRQCLYIPLLPVRSDTGAA